jgi:hypothetical protein
MAGTLEALRAELAEHLLAMPVMPSPYEPHTEAGKAYYAARHAWSDRRKRLEHEIWKLETPRTVFTRTDPGRTPPRVYPGAPARIRR